MSSMWDQDCRRELHENLLVEQKKIRWLVQVKRPPTIQKSSEINLPGRISDEEGTENGIFCASLLAAGIF